jgi:hypothetical protein
MANRSTIVKSKVRTPFLSTLRLIALILGVANRVHIKNITKGPLHESTKPRFTLSRITHTERTSRISKKLLHLTSRFLHSNLLPSSATTVSNDAQYSPNAFHSSLFCDS